MALTVRGALRGLRNGGGATLLAFALLSLALGAGTVTFSVVDAVAIRPAPYAAPRQLVDLSLPGPVVGTRFPGTLSDYLTWRERSSTLLSVGAARLTSARIDIEGTATILAAREVSTNLFDVLGVSASVGHLFGPDHEQPGRDDATVLSHELWRRRFGGDPGVIGRRLRFEDRTREVVGVLPAGVWYPILAGPPPDLYFPRAFTAADRLNSRCCVFVVGRLRPGVTIGQARAEIQGFSSALVVPMQDAIVGPRGAMMRAVLWAVALVLIVACLNVAVVLLARSVVRRPEFATREALGASRAQLASQMIIEALGLAAASVVVGLILSTWGVAIATHNLPPMLTRVSTIAMNGRVLTVSTIAAVVCGLAFGTAPAWLASRRGHVAYLQAGVGQVVRGRRSRLLAGFLVANLALVTMLLAMTTQVVATFIRLTTADLGFDRQHVMTVGYGQPLAGLAKRDWSAAAAAIRAEVIARARAVPGVVDAAISVGGRAPLADVSGVDTDDALLFDRVTPEYFSTLGMSMIRGRTFNATDGVGTRAVVVVNDAAARKWFRDRDPVGQLASFMDDGSATIIGVVRGGRFDGPEARIRPAVFVPASQYDLTQEAEMAMGVLFVRTRTDPRALADAIRAAIRPTLAVEPGAAAFVDDHFQFLTAQRRFNAAVMGMFGLLAMIVGATSVYGTTSFVVAQQVRAIGLRMALGASPSRIMRAVLGQAMLQAALGATIGLVSAMGASAALAHSVVGISAIDAAWLIPMGGILAMICAGAALVPAMRAARLDPVAAMREH